jgi:hypothetical protein
MVQFEEKRLQLGQRLWVNDATTYFGHSVAIDKNLAIVGDYDGGYYRSDKIGHAYIFSRENNEWRLDSRIKVLDLKTFECFGCSVAVNDGDKIAIVGAYYAQNLNKQTVGAAYVFQLEGEIWQQKQKLQPLDLQSDAGFGSAVAMKGNLAVVGAPQGVGSSTKKVGAAYLFRLEGDKWEKVQKLQAPDMGGGDRFGCSVAISETAAIVGSNGADGYRKNDTGSAYIFQLENGISTGWQKLQPADLRGGEWFGCSVAIAGDWAIVGACKANVSGKIQAGAAYIFQLYAGQWKLYQKIQPQEEPQAYAGFGCDVAIGDGVAVVGADYADAPGKKDAGAVYLFQFEKGEWEQKQVFQPQDLNDGDEWGKSVAYSENTAIAGIRGWPGRKHPGFAYIADVEPLFPSPTVKE